MRTTVTFLLSGLTVAAGIVTAMIQCNNHERARRLAELQRSWEHLEAINVQREARAAAHVVAFEDELIEAGELSGLVPAEGVQ